MKRSSGGPRARPLLTAARAALLSTVRARRRDLAIIKTLGATRRQITGIVAWQAITALGIAAVVGTPLGLAAGRQAWQWAAHGIGTLAGPKVPTVALAVLAGGIAAVAVFVSVVPAVAATRTPAAEALHSE